MCSKSAESEMFDSGAQLPLSLIQRLKQEHLMLRTHGSTKMFSNLTLYILPETRSVMTTYCPANHIWIIPASSCIRASWNDV